MGLPSTLTIPVRIQLKPTIFSVKNLFEKNENKQEKRLWLAHLKRKKERKKERKKREGKKASKLFSQISPPKICFENETFFNQR